VIRGVDTIKLWVRRGVLALLLADAVLLGIIWWNASLHPEIQQESLERLRGQHRLLAADVRRAADIRERLPAVERQGDEFLNGTLLPASSGYSTILADLGHIATTAGLPPGAIGFRQKEPDKQGIVEVEVSAALDGDYPALVKFINGLERSDNLYLLDSLKLTAGHDRGIRLSLVLRTYFRS
jgi:Tfp pilus assembly protein PilO